MHIKLSYLYRDAGNYKNYYEIVFSNPHNISIEEVTTSIENHLIGGLWFVASDWQVPDLHFKDEPWDNDLDHEWHEFDNIVETLELPTTTESIDHLLKRSKEQACVN